MPVVLHLKGNLEMNLSARLGTAANIGELDDPSVRRSMIIGNLLQPLTIAGPSYICIFHRIMHGSHSWAFRTAKHSRAYQGLSCD